MFRFDTSISSAIETEGANSQQPAVATSARLNAELLDRIHRYWQAANYLTIGQIYLQENALLREPLRPEHIKPRLLGHWGTSPGLNLMYAHLNLLINEHDANLIFLAGPGHGGPAVIANVYLEGTYSEVYPKVSKDIGGMRQLFRRFSTPGGVPSHVSVPTPGSIHEGGELGYVLAHAFGAAFDNPDLIVAAVVGDGEAETGPLSGSWKSVKYLNAERDGAVLPILHLNGYKIANPTALARSSDEEVKSLLEASGYEPLFIEGADPVHVHQVLAAALDQSYAWIRRNQSEACANGSQPDTQWPAIVLRTPKGWTGPREVDGLPIEGTFRAHQVPLANVRDNPAHLAMLEQWLRSYRPEQLFDASGRLIEELASLAPKNDRRMGANPHANGGRLLKPLNLPDFGEYALPVERPASERHESTRQFGKMLRDVFTLNKAEANFRITCPDEMNSNRLGDVFAVENRCFTGRTINIDDHVSADGRVMEVLSEHLCEGWLEGYILTGRHGLYVTYEAFAMISASMTVQHTKWLEEAVRLEWRAPIASLNLLLTSTCWRNDHNGFSHQGPGLIDVLLSKRGIVTRIYLPPDANCLLSVADHCLRSRNYVNLIVIDKQPQLQWLNMEAAKEHCARGASMWEWASTNCGEEPDVVLASAGDVPTQEIVAAASWLREHASELRVRVVNVVDLMALFPTEVHPHGMSESDFVGLFTRDKPVVFAFHGYQRALHAIVHGRPRADRFHVRGFNEQGTTTTPFQMVVLNEISRYHIAIAALRRANRPDIATQVLIDRCHAAIRSATEYAHEHFEDPSDIRDWIWREARKQSK
jgi:xylulose-5-phosphate/fructose-6-phosphate phosphoketolase